MTGKFAKQDKMKLFILFAIGIVMAITVINPIKAFTQTGSRKTDSIFNTFKSGSFHMKGNMWTNGAVQGTFETYFKDGNMASITTAQGMTSRIINKDKKTYMIMDSEKMVMVTPLQNQPQAGTSTEGFVYLSSGTAEFHGKNLPYEEYSDPKSGKDSKVQYFFDGNKLAGIRNIAAQMSADMEILALDQNIPGNVFDIPAGYQVTDMSAFGR